MNSLLREALQRVPEEKSDGCLPSPTEGRILPSVVSIKRGGSRAHRRNPGHSKVCRHGPYLEAQVCEPVIENCVDLRIVQKLGRWSNLKMLERYGHVSASRKVAAVERLVAIGEPGQCDRYQLGDLDDDRLRSFAKTFRNARR
jgi:hypothetical protein